MISLNPRVVVIDNNEKHLSALSDALNSKRVGHFSYLYKDQFPDASSVEGVRAIFCDINLDDDAVTTDAKAHLSKIISFLETSIADDNGPYVLVLWSQKKDWIDQANKYVDEMNPLKRPVRIEPLDKHSFIDLANGQVLVGADLPAAVLKSLEAHAPIKALLYWEAAASFAAMKTVAEVFRLADPVKLKLNTREEALTKLLTSLAVASQERESDKAEPVRLVQQALIPLLSDRLLHHKFAEEQNNVWKQAIPKLGKLDKLEAETASGLNQMLHVDSRSNAVSCYERGALSELPANWASERGLGRLFGVDANKLQGAYFLSKLPTPQQGVWCLIQMEAGCDAAQSKSGPKPFILALAVKSSASSEFCKGKKDEKTGAWETDLDFSSGIWESPMLPFKGEMSKLRANPRFVIGLPKGKTKCLGQPVFRIRDQLLDSLIFRVRTHSARLGIVEL